ncbi:hypothetical protein KIPB_014057, partial [Kipferlia bialata]
YGMTEHVLPMPGTPYLEAEGEVEGAINKIFSSVWLDDDTVLFGTKNNRLCRFKVSTNTMDYIPPAITSATPCAGGVYCLELCPSRHMLVASSQVTHSLVIYQVPQMHVLYICKGH